MRSCKEAKAIARKLDRIECALREERRFTLSDKVSLAAAIVWDYALGPSFKSVTRKRKTMMQNDGGTGWWDAPADSTGDSDRPGGLKRRVTKKKVKKAKKKAKKVAKRKRRSPRSLGVA